MTVSVDFFGAAGIVTGSCYRISHPGGRFLVDCGMFQGAKVARELNYQSFPFDTAEIECVLLTHAHIDHSGLLPKLANAGFSGTIHATEGSRDLLAYMLPDSGYIQETEVERLNRRNARRGRPRVVPIYTRDDAVGCLSQIRPVDYDRWYDVGRGVRARYWNAGHILGSASIELEVATGTPGQRPLHLLFSGDIGPEHKLLHPDPDAPTDLDYIFCESTYGDRERPLATPKQRRAVLADEVRSAIKRGGNLLIPSFAIERTQELLLDLSALMANGEVPEQPIFLDSPLAINATEVFRRHAEDLEDLDGGIDPFQNPNIHFTATVEESKAIARFDAGAIIMAASGMCDAGRIRHHLKRHLWRRDSTVMLVGYQAPGTLGQLLAQGKTSVRIHGEDIAVRAAIRQIDVYSGHADQSQLVDWVTERLPIHRGVFLTHGEDEARKVLRSLLIENGVPQRRIFLPQLDDTFDLVAARRPRKVTSPHRLPPNVVGRTDWHNDYAQFVIDLQKTLRKADDDKQRLGLLRRLRTALRGQGRK